MSFLRNLTRQSAPFRPLTRRTPQVAFANRLYATQDYGGSGIAGEDPKKQGTNPSEKLEHPGPAAPSTGKGDSSSKPQQQQGGSSADQSSQQSDSSNKGASAAQPKILSESAPKADDQSADVQQHNREMDQRAEKTHEKVPSDDAEKQKVGKEFWSGHGGADKDP